MAERLGDNPTPARSSRASAQDELDSILLEAKSVRGVREAKDSADVQAGLPANTAGIKFIGPPVPGVPANTVSRDSVRYEGPRFDVVEPGATRFRTLRVSPQLALALILGAIATFLWVAMPGGVEALQARPASRSFADASSRWALVLTAERIERFATEHGRLPTSLDELGDGPTDLVTYQTLGDNGYRLEAPGENSVLVLDPSTSAASTLATSADLLRAGPKEGR